MKNHVYQFKIELNGTKPLIWRRVIVSESYTFWDLHVAIHDAMVWSDHHLNQFKIIVTKSGLMIRKNAWKNY